MTITLNGSDLTVTRVGRDPLRIARHVATIESIGFHAGRYWPLEAALWDIIGQVAGQPVSVLFGGARRRLPAYASFGEVRGPQERAAAAMAAKAAGFRAVKIRIDRTDPGASLQAVRAARAAVGPEMVIMADPNQWWRMPGRPWFTPHTWTNGLGLLGNLHVAAGVGGRPYLEFPWDPPGWTPERRDFFLAEPIRIDPDGCLAVPAARASAPGSMPAP